MILHYILSHLYIFNLPHDFYKIVIIIFLNGIEILMGKKVKILNMHDKYLAMKNH